jgi:hypothetical protein
MCSTPPLPLPMCIGMLSAGRKLIDDSQIIDAAPLIENAGLRMPGKNPIGAALAVHAIRYLAASQAFAMVFFHAGWMLLAVATWGHVAGADSGTAAVTRTLVRAYAWLGGVDANGHGDAHSLMVVWARIALAVYAFEVLWRWRFGRRAPMRLWRVAGISWLTAQLGYVVALVPTGSLIDATVVIVLFPLLACAATVWSIAVHRFAESIVARIEPGGVAVQADPGASAR